MEPKERLRECIESAIAANKGDLEESIAVAAGAVRAISDAEVDRILWQRGLQQFVYDIRHQLNSQFKSSVFKPADPKVIAGNSEATSRVGLALAEYEYFIAGRSLGDVLGEELGSIADSESERASGHEFNAKLCRRLQPMVPEGKTVRQAVRAKQLKQIFVELGAGGAKNAVVTTRALRSSGPGTNGRRVAAAAAK